MKFSQKQCSNDGSRPDPNPAIPDQPPGLGGDDRGVLNVDNLLLEDSSGVGDEMHNSDSRFTGSSRATSLLSTQHRIENQLMMNPSHVKRPASGDSDSSKRTKSAHDSHDLADVVEPATPRPGDGAFDGAASLEKNEIIQVCRSGQSFTSNSSSEHDKLIEKVRKLEKDNAELR